MKNRRFCHLLPCNTIGMIYGDANGTNRPPDVCKAEKERNGHVYSNWYTTTFSSKPCPHGVLKKVFFESPKFSFKRDFVRAPFDPDFVNESIVTISFSCSSTNTRGIDWYPLHYHRPFQSVYMTGK